MPSANVPTKHRHFKTSCIYTAQGRSTLLPQNPTIEELSRSERSAFNVFGRLKHDSRSVLTAGDYEPENADTNFGSPPITKGRVPAQEKYATQNLEAGNVKQSHGHSRLTSEQSPLARVRKSLLAKACQSEMINPSPLKLF